MNGLETLTRKRPTPTSDSYESAAPDAQLEPIDQDRPEQLVRTTVRSEALRLGMIRPVLQTTVAGGMLILVAGSYFNAGQTAKGLLGGAVHYGFLLTPLFVPLLAWLGWRVSRAMGLKLSVAAAGMVIAAMAPDLPLFMLGAMLSISACSLTAPLMTALWRQNVPGSSRGRRFSIVSMTAGTAALVVSMLVAWIMGDEVERFRPVMMGFALMLAVAALTVTQVPSQPLARAPGHPLAFLSILWQFPTFGYISASWMILGFANLAMIPLRMEFLTVEAYGHAYTPRQALLLTAVIPAVMMLISTLIWGRLFDRLNFLLIRIMINVLFAVSVLLFFSGNVVLQVAGSITFGLAEGGGNVAWNMWVTKYAPRQRTAEFMSVHTFLTGIRGVLGPLVAFHAVTVMPLTDVAMMAAMLILLATVMLVPLLRMGRGD